ncbi:MAG: 50S ribosomal protein L17 [Flavobacteriales bacterium]|jgi:large subunit ribosomal protein L17|nr:50S ribosomal protein L17 [Flavobacteriales bacterium]
MRHGKKFNHLGRKTAHRKAMLSNMASSLILHKRINTTVAKAKALRLFVEPLLTKSKTDSTHSRRVVFSYLQNKHSVSELFRDVAPKIADRPGGYTRILKTGNRLGDNAEMCLIELVDFNETYTTEKKSAAKKKRRRGGSGKGAAKAAPAKVEAVEDVEIVEETIETEAKVEAPVIEDVKEEAKAEAKTEEISKAEESKDDKTTEDDKQKSE